MQFEDSPRNIRRSLVQNARTPTRLRTEELNLQMYINPPTENITLIEFQELSLNRLRVLKTMEQVKDRFPRDTEALNDALAKELMKLMPIACGCCPVEKMEAERRRDIISHFILRLAFCQTPEQTKWFIQQEVDLFRFRFQMISKNRDAVTQFLQANNFDAHLLTDIEKQNIKESLSNACSVPLNKYPEGGCLLFCSRLANFFPSLEETTSFWQRQLSFGSCWVKSQLMKIAETDFWKVPFVDALDLVRKRRVLLVSGYAFVSEDDLQVILYTRFRLNMAAAMARTCRNIGFIEEDDRLMPFLKKLSNRSYVGKNYIGRNDSNIRLDMIDSLAATSFPLCMRNIHTRLRADHHLRHGARMQYGLFLKAIGIKLEDALSFWKAEFTKIMDPDKFDKQYAYNIRHNYGKEGKHADYAAYPCTKIILDVAPSAADCHGCPYRHSDSQLLTQKLEMSGLSKSQIDTIISLSASAQYDKACTRYFEFTHKMIENSLSTVITHPNQYFDLSRQVYEGRRNREEEPKFEITLSTKSAIVEGQKMDVDIEDLLNP